MKGQAKILNQNGWDVAAVNFRGCSGEANLSYQSYNAGKTDDLEAVINFILKKNKYSEIAPVGFSLGGNLLLKYLGERESFPKEIKKAVAISTPLSLKGSLESLNEFSNWVYRNSFLINLRKKYKAKMKDFPEKMTASDYKKITSLLEFDNVYTAPAHGFKDAFDYYEKNSSLQFLPKIKIPVFVLNAENDSFLSSECYPTDLASKMKNLFLETPKYGGHVGFHQTNKLYYSETRTFEFLNSK
jgi:predicted alpha/beta-fold hydrolase